MALPANEPVFTTKVTQDELWINYMMSLPESVRDEHNCNTCRSFLGHYGGLAYVNEAGIMRSVLWGESLPGLYHDAVEELNGLVQRSYITGVFIPWASELGNAKTGEWKHLSMKVPVSRIPLGSMRNVDQLMAEKLEDYRNMQRATAEYKQSVVEAAVHVLSTEMLYRSEKVLGAAEWLRDLYQKLGSVHGPYRSHILWKAVATAPAGFCHPRSSMIGTLLDDIQSGMNYQEAGRRFKQKMDPLVYQRPQAPAKSGNIDVAEKLIKKMGAESALRRRYARLEDVEAIWTPEAIVVHDKGVFGKLRGSKVSDTRTLPPITMTWEKFNRTVLPTATNIEICAPNRGSYSSLITASDPYAVPIIQWDSVEKRNPVSWYFWHGGATAQQFGLSSGFWYKLNAVCLKPSMWNGGFDHQGKGVMFIIYGAADTRRAGLCLFPEILRSEFREVRSVIEQYMKTETLEGFEHQSAAGIMVNSGGDTWGEVLLRVRTGDITQQYKLDRWD